MAGAPYLPQRTPPGCPVTGPPPERYADPPPALPIRLPPPPPPPPPLVASPPAVSWALAQAGGTARRLGYVLQTAVPLGAPALAMLDPMPLYQRRGPWPPQMPPTSWPTARAQCRRAVDLAQTEWRRVRARQGPIALGTGLLNAGGYSSSDLASHINVPWLHATYRGGNFTVMRVHSCDT